MKGVKNGKAARPATKGGKPRGKPGAKPASTPGGQGAKPVHTDISRTGWVARLPPRLQNYVLLARLDRPIGTWLLFLPGLWSICLTAPGPWRGLYLAVLFVLGSLAMRSAGCVVNDLWDRKLDAKVERTKTRPLASGAIKPWQALLFLAGLCLIGLGILLLLNRLAQILGVASLVLVALYPVAKRITWWPQAVLGCVFGWGAPMGYAAAAGHLAWPALPLYAGTILWILGYDTIYAHQDREDDSLIGIKSTALLFGEKSIMLITFCYSAFLLLLATAMGLSVRHLAACWLLLAPAGLLAWQIIRLDINNPGRCLTLFKLNREVGLLVAAAIIVGRV